jgi:hypothetical protein
MALIYNFTQILTFTGQYSVSVHLQSQTQLTIMGLPRGFFLMVVRGREESPLRKANLGTFVILLHTIFIHTYFIQLFSTSQHVTINSHQELHGKSHFAQISHIFCTAASSFSVQVSFLRHLDRL